MKSLLYKTPSSLSVLCAALLLFLSVGASSATAAGIDVYLSAPGSQTSIYSNVVTETFNTLSTGVYSAPLTSAIGTYQLSTNSKLAVVADNAYGAGTGNYVSLGAQSSSSGQVVLQLNNPVSYFGFSWNAGDAYNQLTFYNNSTLVGFYDTASIFAVLKNMTVAPLSGPTYLSSDYYGKPGSGSPRSNSSEPYAFINFVANGVTFNSIILSNSNTTATGFETDNHTIRTVAPTPDSSFVRVGSTFTPEPGNFALCMGLMVACSMLGLRRRVRR